jgi:DNA-binding response OmpR family regulator
MHGKILVVENEPDLSEALMTVLAHEGFEVTVEADGEAGLATALREKPDVILLDIMMPEMDGLTLLQYLRSDEWGKHANVIMMTAFDDTEKIKRAAELGAPDYIIKTNVTLAAVVAKVKEKLGL